MSDNITVDLRLITNAKKEYELQYQKKDGSYSKVTNTEPNLGINGEDTLKWVCTDGSISKIKIKFFKGNIVKNKNIKHNKSPNPEVTCKLPRENKGSNKKKSYDSYEIKVKPSQGGGYEDYDPPITYPDT